MSADWRAVVGHEGAYEVSADGQVRSLTRRVPNGTRRGRIVHGRVLRASKRGDYLAVSIAGQRRDVHVLVAEAFICPRPPGMVVCHNDGDQLNNAAENLRWGTPSENTLDSVRHGTHNRASRAACSRGHDYSPKNTSVKTDGSRRCLTCHRENERARSLRAYRSLEQAS